MSVTRANIRNRARIRADQTDSTFPTDDEYDLLINEALQEAWFDLVQAGWPWEQEEWSIVLDGSTSYDLGVARTQATCGFPRGAGTDPTLRWVDDGDDPADKNDWTLVIVQGHTGAPDFEVTVDTVAKTVTVDYDDNPVTIPFGDAVGADLEATGLFEMVDPASAPWTDTVDKTPQTVAFSGGTAGSAQVFGVNGVCRSDAIRTPLRRLDEGSRESLETGTGLPTAYEVVMTATGAQLRVYPPTATGTVIARVLREHAGLEADTDRWYGPARSDELIVLKAAAKGCRKEGNDQGAAQLDREYMLLLEKVQNMASWMHMRHAPVIRDVGDQFMRRDPFDYDV